MLKQPNYSRRSAMKIMVNPYQKIVQYSNGMPDVIFRMYT